MTGSGGAKEDAGGDVAVDAEPAPTRPGGKTGPTTTPRSWSRARWLPGVLLAAISLTVLLAPRPPVAAGVASWDAALAREAAAGLRSGQWNLAWAADLPAAGGSPAFLFHPKGAFYPAGALVLARLPAPFAVATLRVMALLLAMLLAYRLGRMLWGWGAGCLVAATYLIAAHLLGPATALAPAVAAIWPPWILAAAWRWSEGGGDRHWLTLVGGLTALGLSDYRAAAVLAPVLGAYLLTLPARPTGMRSRLLLALGVAAGGTAFVWMPALGERSLLRGPAPGAPAWSTSLSPWALGGAMLLAGTALALGRDDRARRWTVVSVVLLLVGTGGSMVRDAPPGHGGLAVALAAALATGAAVGALRSRRVASILATAICLSLPALLLLDWPAGPPPIPTAERAARMAPRWAGSIHPVSPDAARFPTPGGCQLDQVRPGTHRHFFDALCEEPVLLEARLFYYPGWSVWVDNRAVEPGVHPVRGTLQIPIPEGVHRVKVSFEHTPLRRTATAASLASTVLCLGTFLLLRAPGQPWGRENRSGN